MAPNNAADLRAVAERYTDLRRQVYRFTESEFKHLSVEMSAISSQDAQDGDLWQDQWTDPQKRPIWTWTRMYRDYHGKRGIKRFDAALRSHGQLCALCYGIPSRKKLYLKLHALARAPHGNPLAGQVFRIMFFAATSYATLLGSQQLWLEHPQTEGVAQFYARFGFEIHRNAQGQATHLTRIV